MSGPAAAAQRAFAAHLRDPVANPPPPGIEDRRLAVYRDLFLNNVAGFLDTFFPVLRSVYGQQRWRLLARDFLARHRCESPYFLAIAEEFLHYLEHERPASADDPAFALELARWEWLELVLEVAEEEIPVAGVDPAGDLVDGVPVLSPLAVLHAGHWPVHRIGPDFLPAAPEPQPRFLLVYRDRRDAVRFLELNAASAQLFTLLREQPALAGRAAAAALAAAWQHPDPAVVLAGVAETLEGWRARDIIAGSRLSD